MDPNDLLSTDAPRRVRRPTATHASPMRTRRRSVLPGAGAPFLLDKTTGDSAAPRPPTLVAGAWPAPELRPCGSTGRSGDAPSTCQIELFLRRWRPANSRLSDPPATVRENWTIRGEGVMTRAQAIKRFHKMTVAEDLGSVSPVVLGVQKAPGWVVPPPGVSSDITF